MANLAAAESLAHLLTAQGHLFQSSEPDDVRSGLASTANEKAFGLVARDFFARFTRRALQFYLDRELPNHVGGDRTFANLDDRSQFDNALRTHCQEASLIVERFAADWFSKKSWSASPTKNDVFGFSNRAFKKLSAELQRGARRS